VPRVAVRIEDFERGDMPAICAKTGVPCDNPVALRLRIGRRPVPGILPIVSSRARLVRWLIRTSFFVLAAAVVLAFVSFDYAAIAVAVYVVVFIVGDQLWVGSKGADERDLIVLTRVHRNFVDAVSR
jgi:hypothetical protein